MLIDLLEKRKSTRVFKDEHVSDEIIHKILESGRLSPSGGNEQSWMFGVIKDRTLIHNITESAYNQKWIESADFVVVLCTRIVSKDRGGRDIQIARFPQLADEIETMDDKLYACLTLEEHQTKIPGTHMVLTALEHGVGSTWVSYFDVERVSKFLLLPDDCIASEILAFGYPKSEMKPTKKKEMDELLFYNQYQSTQNNIKK